MTEKEKFVIRLKHYFPDIKLTESYMHFAYTFNQIDKDKKDLQIHHVIPRCCGGTNDNYNLVKVTFHHHRTLHRLILLSDGFTEEQLNKLKYAYNEMKRHH